MFSDWILGVDANLFLDRLGQELISTACVGLLEKAFRCLGNDLTAFLTTLDGVNDVVQHQSGTNTEAEFVCIATSGALELHFTTDHLSTAYLLVGSLKGIAKQFYNDKADVYILPDPYNTKFFRYFYYFILLYGTLLKYNNQNIDCNHRKKYIY